MPCRHSQSAFGVLGGIALHALCTMACSADDLAFTTVSIDRAGPRAPWAKGVADINQDGLTDILIGGHQIPDFSLGERIANKLGLIDLTDRRGELVWYEAPEWTRHTVSNAFAVRTDVEAGDVDADGDIDIVALTDRGVVWFEAPEWQPHVIDARKFHDVELTQLNDDARPDLVLRNQSLFGYNNGDDLVIMLSQSDGQWDTLGLSAPQGEGLQVVRGARPTVIVNDVLYVAPAADKVDDPGAWRRVRYTSTDWDWPHVVVAAGDFNSDGHLDVALAPAEEKGQRYRLSWFEGPSAAGQPWREHVVLDDTEAVHHALVAADFDGDGQTDLATAQMTQGADPDEVLLLRNLGNGGTFARQVLATSGSHNLHVLDADGDFDPDIVGANWQRDNYKGDYAVTLWRNDREQTLWPRHVLDDARPGQALNVLPADLDGDEFVDVVSGAFWYRNSGRLGAPWVRAELGSGSGNALLVANIDDDETPDVVASAWSGYSKPTLMARIKAKLGSGPDPWQKNANSLMVHFGPASESPSSMQVATDLPGDFPHGAALRASDNGRALSLSMHAKNTPVVTLSLPADARQGSWPVAGQSLYSQNEALSVVDLNQDGRLDLVTGTRWIDGRSGEQHIISDAALPDRHVVIAPIDGQALEIVVGDEAISRRGRITLYRASNSGWDATVIGEVVGPMSLDAGDIDLDGDIDVVVGEHNLANPAQARLIWFERRGAHWIAHLIGVGDEHHDGAQLADLDRDGDLDIVSIGWGHGRVLAYENPLRSP